MDIVTTPCRVTAMRQDGALRTVSEPVDVVPTPGHDVVLDITLPAAPKAGLGIQVGVTESGIEIQGVVDGGPAQAAGLIPGDLVVQVDGQSAADLTLPEFVALAAGPAGSPIVLGVERAGQRLDLTVVRAPIPG
jgi:carboxyl-terminal processing protease